jgi:hypothetical protein
MPPNIRPPFPYRSTWSSVSRRFLWTAHLRARAHCVHPSLGAAALQSPCAHRSSPRGPSRNRCRHPRTSRYSKTTPIVPTGVPSPRCPSIVARRSSGTLARSADTGTLEVARPQGPPVARAVPGVPAKIATESPISVHGERPRRRSGEETQGVRLLQDFFHIRPAHVHFPHLVRRRVRGDGREDQPAVTEECEHGQAGPRQSSPRVASTHRVPNQQLVGTASVRDGPGKYRLGRALATGTAV